jgi:transcriptional regulator with XRE-family HTH domain
MLAAMDTVRVGRAFRAVRIRRGWRQQDVAERAAVHRSTISLIERGHWRRLSHDVLQRVGEVLEIRITVQASWRGGDLDRLINSDHSAMHEVVGRLFDGLPGWVRSPEVTFAVYRERGVIDILAFHEDSGALLVIEIKTVISDVNDLVGVVDRKVRLAAQIAAERGWEAKSVSAWVVVAESRSNRRRLAAHRSMLRPAFPADGHAVRRWLDAPGGAVRALSFLSLATGSSGSRRHAGVKRVRKAV